MIARARGQTSSYQTLSANRRPIANNSADTFGHRPLRAASRHKDDQTNDGSRSRPLAGFPAVCFFSQRNAHEDDGLAEVNQFANSPPVTSPRARDNTRDLFLLDNDDATTVGDTNVVDLVR